MDPRDSFVPHCKVAPRRLADSGTGVLKGGRIGSKHRWTLDREWRAEDGRAQGVSAQVVSGDTGKKGAMSRFEQAWEMGVTARSAPGEAQVAESDGGHWRLGHDPLCPDFCAQCPSIRDTNTRATSVQVSVHLHRRVSGENG